MMSKLHIPTVAIHTDSSRRQTRYTLCPIWELDYTVSIIKNGTLQACILCRRSMIFVDAFALETIHILCAVLERLLQLGE